MLNVAHAHAHVRATRTGDYVRLPLAASQTSCYIVLPSIIDQPFAKYCARHRNEPSVSHSWNLPLVIQHRSQCTLPSCCKSLTWRVAYMVPESPHTPTSSNSSALFGSDDTSFLEAIACSVLPGDLIPNATNPEEALQNPSKTPPASTGPSNSSLEPPPCAQPRSNAYSDVSSGDEQDTPATRTPSNAQLHLKHSPIVLSEDDEPTLLQTESLTPAQSRYKKRAYSVSSDDENPVLARSPVNSPTQITKSYLDPDTYGASRFGEFGEYMRRKRAKLQIQNAEMGGTPGVVASKSRLFNGLSIHVGQPSPALVVDVLKGVRLMDGQSPLFKSCER